MPQRHIPIEPEIPDWNLESLSQEIIDTKAELERINKKSKSNLRGTIPRGTIHPIRIVQVRPIGIIGRKVIQS